MNSAIQELKRATQMNRSKAMIANKRAFSTQKSGRKSVSPFSRDQAYYLAHVQVVNNSQNCVYRKTSKSQLKSRKAQSNEHRNLTPGAQRTQRPAQNNYLQPSSSQNSFSTQRSMKAPGGLESNSEYQLAKAGKFAEQERLRKSYQSEQISYTGLSKSGLSREENPINLSFDQNSRFYSPSNRGVVAYSYLRGQPQSAEASKAHQSRIAAMSKYIPGIHAPTENQIRKNKTSSSFSNPAVNIGGQIHTTAKLIQKGEEGIYEPKGQVSPISKNIVPTTETNSSTMPLSLQPYAQNSLAALQKSNSPIGRRGIGYPQLQESSKDTTTMLTNKLSLDVMNGNSTVLGGMTGSQLNHALTTGHINTTIAFLSAADTESLEDLHLLHVAFHQRSRVLVKKLDGGERSNRDPIEEDLREDDNLVEVLCEEEFIE